MYRNKWVKRMANLLLKSGKIILLHIINVAIRVAECTRSKLSLNLSHPDGRVRDKRPLLPRSYWPPSTGATVSMETILPDDVTFSPIHFKRTIRCMLHKHNIGRHHWRLFLYFVVRPKQHCGHLNTEGARYTEIRYLPCPPNSSTNTGVDQEPGNQ